MLRTKVNVLFKQSFNYYRFITEKMWWAKELCLPLDA